MPKSQDDEYDAILDCLAVHIEGDYPAGAHSIKLTGKEQAKAKLQARVDRKVTETEKAYGGCRNCYGKGYATVNDRWGGRDTDQDIGSPGGVVTGGNANEMKFCTCSRGTQLKEAVDRKVAEALDSATALQPFEVANYKRLMALEAKGIEEYRDMRATPPMTPEAVVSFINQLSPWNLKTTGLEVLKAYVQAQLPKNEKGEGDDRTS